MSHRVWEWLVWGRSWKNAGWAEAWALILIGWREQALPASSVRRKCLSCITRHHASVFHITSPALGQAGTCEDLWGSGHLQVLHDILSTLSETQFLLHDQKNQFCRQLSLRKIFFIGFIYLIFSLLVKWINWTGEMREVERKAATIKQNWHFTVKRWPDPQGLASALAYFHNIIMCAL